MIVVKIGDKVDVITPYKVEPLFTGRVTRLHKDKEFVYVRGSFNYAAFPRVLSVAAAVEINISRKNLRLA